MRKKRRILAAALAGVMMLGMTACGNSNAASRQTETAGETTAQAESRSEESAGEDTVSAQNGPGDQVGQMGQTELADGVVQTTAGLVQGTDEDGIWRYLGVPYAEAKERFVPAEEATSWEGVRMADSYGPMSPQGAISGLGAGGAQDGTDNNSQNLNIWTPGVNDGEKRPVMVWLHGGGFSTGSANEAGYDGENISRSGDVVVVSVNHRLNAFGFLDLSAYGEKFGGGYSMDWEPVVDGDFLPTDPVTEESFAEAGKDIPLLIGSNLNEWSGFFESNPIEPTEELTEALREAYPDKADLTAEQVDTTTIRLQLLKIMTHKADQNGAPVYAYLFTYGNSYHGAEIPYVFDLAEGSEEEQTLAKQVSRAWINFAKTGVPSAEGLPEWEPYTREGGATMILDTESRMAYHHDQKLLSILVPDYQY